MKYIRIFESYFGIFDIKIGDYVLADYTYDENPKWTEYIRNSAGEVLDIVASTYEVKYIIDDYGYNTLISDDRRLLKKMMMVRNI